MLFKYCTRSFIKIIRMEKWVSLSTSKVLFWISLPVNYKQPVLNLVPFANQAFCQLMFHSDISHGPSAWKAFLLFSSVSLSPVNSPGLNSGPYSKPVSILLYNVQFSFMALNTIVMRKKLCNILFYIFFHHRSSNWTWTVFHSNIFIRFII